MALGLMLHSRCSHSNAGCPSFLGDLPDLHPEEEFPEQDFSRSTGGNNLSSAVKQALGRGYVLPSALLTFYMFWCPIAPTSAAIPTTKNLHFCLFCSFLILNPKGWILLWAVAVGVKITFKEDLPVSHESDEDQDLEDRRG